jgi:MFS family permease
LPGYGLSRILLTPSIGSLSDRFGRKWFITGGLPYTVVSVCTGSLLDLRTCSRSGLSTGSCICNDRGQLQWPMLRISPPADSKAIQGKLSNAFYLGMGSGPLIGGGRSTAYPG